MVAHIMSYQKESSVVEGKVLKKKKTILSPAVANSAAASHPTYEKMVVQAIVALNNRGGSSRAAIQNYIAANFTLGGTSTMINTNLRNALKRGLNAGNFELIKGSSVTGYFCLGNKAKETVKRQRNKTILTKKFSKDDDDKKSKKTMSKKKTAVKNENVAKANKEIRQSQKKKAGTRKLATLTATSDKAKKAAAKPVRSTAPKA